MVSKIRRASGELEKGERRSEILALADELFRERSFEEIRMADLAAELGLAKGTLYLYFPSKEALFLALLGDRLESALAKLFDSLESRAAEGVGDGRPSAESVAAATASAMAGDLALPRLLAIMHTVLESRLPFEEAASFKRGLAASLREAGSRLSAAFPPLSEEGGRRFFLYLYAQVVGLVSLTDVSPFMRRVAAEPGLEDFRLSFKDTLYDSTRAMLAGMLEAARSRDEGIGGRKGDTP